MTYGLREIAIGILHGNLPKSAGPDLARERLKVCKDCDEYKKLLGTCALCGCVLEAKVRMLEAECPADKW
jgi:hypothetical protein